MLTGGRPRFSSRRKVGRGLLASGLQGMGGSWLLGTIRAPKSTSGPELQATGRGLVFFAYFFSVFFLIFFPFPGLGDLLRKAEVPPSRYGKTVRVK